MYTPLEFYLLQHKLVVVCMDIPTFTPSMLFNIILLSFLYLLPVLLILLISYLYELFPFSPLLLYLLIFLSLYESLILISLLYYRSFWPLLSSFLRKTKFIVNNKFMSWITVISLFVLKCLIHILLNFTILVIKFIKFMKL